MDVHLNSREKEVSSKTNLTRQRISKEVERDWDPTTDLITYLFGIGKHVVSSRGLLSMSL